MDDLERFWWNILSEDSALIKEAWSTLTAEERDAVTAHLRSMQADPDRHPDQRRAARAALSTPSLSPSRKAGGMQGGVLLASGSPRRRELIALLGLPFDLTSTHVDETPHPGEDPASMVTRLSREKALFARATQIAPSPTRFASGVYEDARTTQLSSYPTILLTADTTVSLDGEILGKPADAAAARSMLARLRGRSHQVFTAVTLIDTATGQEVTDLGVTDVPMRDYSDAEMEAYIATGDPFDKAGSYAIQHDGFNPVTRLRGCYANVVGLPLCHITRSLRALGVEPPVDVPTACQAHLNYECPVFAAILKRETP